MPSDWPPHHGTRQSSRSSRLHESQTNLHLLRAPLPQGFLWHELWWLNWSSSHFDREDGYFQRCIRGTGAAAPNQAELATTCAANECHDKGIFLLLSMSDDSGGASAASAAISAVSDLVCFKKPYAGNTERYCMQDGIIGYKTMFSDEYTGATGPWPGMTASFLDDYLCNPHSPCTKSWLLFMAQSFVVMITGTTAEDEQTKKIFNDLIPAMIKFACLLNTDDLVSHGGYCVTQVNQYPSPPHEGPCTGLTTTTAGTACADYLETYTPLGCCAPSIFDLFKNVRWMRL